MEHSSLNSHWHFCIINTKSPSAVCVEWRFLQWMVPHSQPFRVEDLGPLDFKFTINAFTYWFPVRFNFKIMPQYYELLAENFPKRSLRALTDQSNTTINQSIPLLFIHSPSTHQTITTINPRLLRHPAAACSMKSNQRIATQKQYSTINCTPCEVHASIMYCVRIRHSQIVYKARYAAH